VTDDTTTHRSQALVVRGGWPGHVPVEATDFFIPFLRAHGFDVIARDDLDAYTDEDLMASTDLVVQCWTMGQITAEQSAGLAAAVGAGTGLAGWHGGIVDSFRATPTYLQLTGGQFTCHPGDFIDYELEVRAERADHEIVTGISTVALHTEQYWVLTDDMNDVLATTTLGPGPNWAGVTVPAVWTRRWGDGRVFVCTVGHHLPDLEVPEIRSIIERGMLWASR
jgi:type 1 glutamine amidotransferase